MKLIADYQSDNADEQVQERLYNIDQFEMGQKRPREEVRRLAQHIYHIIIL